MKEGIFYTLVAAGALLLATSCKTTRQTNSAEPSGLTEISQNADPATRDIAEREKVRRQQAMRDADALIEEGNRLRKNGDLEGATNAYQKSLNTIP